MKSGLGFRVSGLGFKVSPVGRLGKTECLVWLGGAGSKAAENRFRV